MSLQNPATLLLLATPEEENYLPRLKSMVGVATVYASCKPVTTLAEIVLSCKKRGVTGVLTTNTLVLSKLLASIGNPKSNPSLDNYAGSYFKYQDIEFVFLPPLEQLITIPYAPFLTKRFISKLTEPESWDEVPPFNWEILDATNSDRIFAEYTSATCIAVDIETLRKNLVIRCIGYTAVFVDSSGSVRTHSCVLPVDSMYAVSLMRKFNWNLQAPKIFQNGKYDISYLARYNAVPYNYLWDTANMFHSWYSELPKDLAFLGAFFVRKAMYWKDLANTSDLHEYYRYNALDTWTTALVAIAWFLQAPKWAKDNYVMEFPLVFPCHMCEMTGIKRDMEELKIARAEADLSIEKNSESLSRMVGIYPRIFNVNSAPQNTVLRKILGCSDITSSGKIFLAKIAARHPINSLIVKKITDIRESRKLASTYLRLDTDKGKTKDEEDGSKELNGRILYAINPHGTDSGRLASREHHFWCGLQIQNIPRGKAVKRTLIADEGFLFAEVDLEQAESRDTAYISGDKALIAAVSSGRDFHATNASSFFGVPYESIYSDTECRTVDKVLRDLAKRVNHGANYLMGPGVLIDTMGEEKVWEARRLLKLPQNFGLIQVAEFLLAQFHRTYPALSGTFYPGVVSAVMTTRMLVGPTGWTRYCFGNPQANKLHKNSYVSHVPQSLNAMVLNKAFMKVFYDIALSIEHRNNFKLIAQIHDSILFQFREGHEYLCEMVRERMEIPVTIKGYDGVTRIFTVPAAIKAGLDGLGSKRWSETE
jgi:DNA polymerase I-like protein with 3'-5' exonuclease and polymerase domains